MKSGLEKVFENIYKLSEDEGSGASCGGVTASNFSGFVPEKVKDLKKEEKEDPEV